MSKQIKYKGEITECASVDEARQDHKKLLNLYNFYMVRDMSYIRPGKIFRVLHCKKENIYIIVMAETIEDRLGKMITKHNRKVEKNKMIYADK